MRDFFINAFEKLIAVIIVLMLLATVIGTIGTAVSGEPGAPMMALVVLIVGLVYTILMGGMLYLFLGIYHNTKRTAELLESRGA